MRAGHYKHRLTLHQTLTTANDFAADNPEESEGIAVYAKLKPTGGDETETANQQESRPKYEITIRWGHALADCDSSWYAKRNNPVTGKPERFEFVSVENVDVANRELLIQARGV